MLQVFLLQWCCVVSNKFVRCYEYMIYVHKILLVSEWYINFVPIDTWNYMSHAPGCVIDTQYLPVQWHWYFSGIRIEQDMLVENYLNH